MELNGGQALIKSLEMEGVEVMFGLPGGAILPVYDPIIDSPIRHILVRHEQGAGHMAEGYAHATGRPGVAMVTSGPAATNIVTPLCDAYMDSIPMVVHHRPGAARRHRHRRLPGVRHHRHHPVGHQAQLAGHRRPQDIPRIVREAFHIATTGRPGPVLVDIPKDIVDPKNPARRWSGTGRPTRTSATACPATSRPPTATPRMIREAAELILASAPAGHLRRRRHPQGPGRRGAARAGRAHATSTSSPRSWPAAPSPTTTRCASACRACTATTPPSRRCSETDLLIALGSRFDDRVTGKVAGFAPDAKIIHVDIDPAELGKVRRPDVADRRRLPPRHRGAGHGRARRCSTAATTLPRPHRRGSRRSRGWQEKLPAHLRAVRADGDALKPQFVLEHAARQQPPTTRSSPRASASTRCGPASTGSSTTPTRG